MRTPSVDRNRYGIFLDRADEFLESAEDGLSQGPHRAAASNAVHAAIAAVDAVAVYHTGKRSAPQRHEDAVHLLFTLGLPDGKIDARARQLMRILGLKAKAEYTDTRVTGREAEDAVRAARHIVEWARTQVPRR